MKISKRAQYGLTAMVHLAGSKTKKAVSIRQISNIEKVPFEYLSKIFSVLEKEKLVLSRHGMNGGYVLARHPDKISVIDVVEPLEKINAVDCLMCPKLKKCLTKNVWKRVDRAVSKTLASITLKDLIK